MMGNQEQCSIDNVLEIIGGKWTINILKELLPAPKRYSQLLNTLVGISPKTLSVRLKSLEQAGIIIRIVHSSMPPKVEYSLSKKGQELKPIFDEMLTWGSEWLK